MKYSPMVNAVNYIDDDLVNEALTCKGHHPGVLIRWGAAAACLCIIIAASALIPSLRQPQVTPGPVNSDHPVQTEPLMHDTLDGEDRTPTTFADDASEFEWPAVFTRVSAVTDAAPKYIPGYFTEELSDAELDAVCPQGVKEAVSGYAGFDGEGKLLGVHLRVDTAENEGVITVSLSETGPARDYITQGNIIVFLCGETEYSLYEWEMSEEKVMLTADAVINGCNFAFTMDAPKDEINAAKEQFVSTLESFADHDENYPDLAPVKASAIPEWFDKTLSYSEALEDDKYGEYMVKQLPQGFAEENIRRYKDANSDYLSGLWTRGYDELSWRVYTISEADEKRLTGIDEKENYDLSLYPIPRADSVPDELREIVNDPIFSAEELTLEVLQARACSLSDSGNTSGPRMAFSVRYGDKVVRVRCKGIEPEWLIEQLMMLK